MRKPNFPAWCYPAFILAVIVTAPFLITGCDSETNTDYTAQNKGIDLVAWQLARAQEAANEATRFIVLTRTFLDKPDAENQAAWRQGWLIAHGAWVNAAFLQQPESDLLSEVDAWPIQAGFIDSLPDYPRSGMVNDITLTIDSPTINHQHQITDDSEVALGFHVLEYYAFDRELASFQVTDSTAERRITMLQIVADQLLSTLLVYTQALKQDGNDIGLPRSYRTLLRHLHQRSQRLFSELNRLGEHGQFSNSAKTSIALQLTTMQALIFEASTLNEYLVALDREAAQITREMLSEAIHIMASDKDLTEAEHSRCLLLLSAITHTLEELARA